MNIKTLGFLGFMILNDIYRRFFPQENMMIVALTRRQMLFPCVLGVLSLVWAKD